jgi:aryl-alcohol dehydrogenase-like predicted oxidoreductase
VKSRLFGKTGWEVGEIGLGTWQIGGDWGEIEEGEARAILATAIDRGVDVFDTADVYGDGRSERRIGEMLRETGRRNTFSDMAD